MTGYPAHWEADVILADGGTVHLRPIVAADAERLVAFHGALSEQTIRYRFFAAHPRLSEKEVEHFTHVDYDSRVALVAVLRGELIAVGRFDRIPGSDVAEVAFVVADAHQRRGLGSVLLEHLAAIAAERGIRQFEADVLSENRGMTSVFREAGYVATTSYEEDVTHLVFPIEPTAASLAVMQSREHRSEARSIRRLLHPRSVAVIGAGQDPDAIGHAVFVNLLRSGFQGPVYPVNSKAEHVASVRAYPTVEDVPGHVDLAVIAVPAPAVADVVSQSARKGVYGLVVMSGGYSETGAAGVEAERALVAEARTNGMRVIGPNCLGVMNAAPGVRLNASLGQTMPAAGRAGLFTQSGALGMAILDSVCQRGLGLSSFVSAGNRADVSGNDLLQYWEDDPETDVVLLYLERFGNPRKFARLARRIGRSKPIVAVKSGGSTAARLTQEDVTEGAVNALFRQAGVIRVDTMSQLFDLATLLTRQPLPAGRRVAVVGNSVPLIGLATDACAGAGLEIAQVPPPTQQAGWAAVSGDDGVGNPVLLPAVCDVDAVQLAVHTLLNDAAVDAAVCVLVLPIGTSTGEMAHRLEAASAATGKPVVSTLLSLDRERSEVDRPAPVPLYPSPEEAVSALARAAVYGEWRRQPEGVVPSFPDIDAEGARKLVESTLSDGSAAVELSEKSVAALLSAYGVNVWASTAVHSLDEALDSARQLGFPVALKATAPSLRHRPDLGAVRLDIGSEDDLRAAYEHMRARLGGSAAGLIVQAMAPPGVATVIRIHEDPAFGALVSFGVGGPATELLGDRAFRFVPLTDLDAAELVRSVRAAPLLFGYRGSDPVDVGDLEQLLLRVARLADDLPEVAELELNPVVAGTSGCTVLQAGVRLTSPTARLDSGPRRLR